MKTAQDIVIPTGRAHSEMNQNKLPSDILTKKKQSVTVQGPEFQQ
jgi:hypothetical protein